MSVLGALGAFLAVLLPAAPGGFSPSIVDRGVGVDTVYDPDLAPLRSANVPPGLPFEPGRAPFTLITRGDPTPFAISFLAALPGEILELELDPGEERPILTYSAGAITSSQEGGWDWKAPLEPGNYALRLDQAGSGESLFLNVFVLHRHGSVESGSLNGYEIGAYESRPLRGDSIYLPPPGFIEVSSHDEDILVAPHFTVGQFLCKQPGNPKYLALSRYLVAKLEAILERSNAEGYPAPTLHVMSGFRTPWYNRSIGNRTVYSRHLWGGAADIFLDADGDGNMDDLNGDGRSSIADAQILYEIAEWVDSSGHPGTRPGGLGAYRRNSVRGPFVHVDARGRAARW
jgi:hypothetical protein